VTITLESLAGKTLDQISFADLAALTELKAQSAQTPVEIAAATSALDIAAKASRERSEAIATVAKDAVFGEIAAFATKVMTEKLGQLLFLDLRPEEGKYTCKTPVIKVKAKGKNGNGTKRGESGKPTKVSMSTIIGAYGALDAFTFGGVRYELQGDLAKAFKAQKGGFSWYEEGVGADGLKHGDGISVAIVRYAIAHPGKVMIAFQANKTPRPLEVVAAEAVKASDGKLKMPSAYSIGGEVEVNGATTPVA